MKCQFYKSIRELPSGFCVYKYTALEELPNDVKGNKNHFTAVGVNLPKSRGTEINLIGKWVANDYGMQFKVANYSEELPSTEQGIKAFLQSGLIDQIGPAIANRIVMKFGTNTFRIFDYEPHRLLDVKGINNEKLEAILNSYAKISNLKNITMELIPYGISSTKIKQIYDKFGVDSAEIIKQEPYKMCEISGFTFDTVDNIAMKMGVRPNAPARIEQAVIQILGSLKTWGHLYTKADILIENSYRLLNSAYSKPVVSKVEIQKQLKAMENKSIKTIKNFVYKYTDFHYELCSAEKVVEYLNTAVSNINIEQMLKQAMNKNNLVLSKKQKAAVHMCMNNQLSIITGIPGSGKTTVLKIILDVAKMLNEDIVIKLAAPTGLASRKMSESTGLDAVTLHNLLGINSVEATIAPECDLLIVDECSMIDARLFYELTKNLSTDTKLLLVGDPDQLPSVGPGNVLKELISCGFIPVTELDFVYRQEHHSSIYANIQNIKEGTTDIIEDNNFKFVEIESENNIADLIETIFVNRFGTEDIQILTPFKREKSISSNILNVKLQSLVNPPKNDLRELSYNGKVFRTKDKVMFIKNRADINVTNGEVGIIKEIKKDIDGKDCIRVLVPPDKVVDLTPDDLGTLEHAYAITIHKSQGSQFKTVIIPMIYSKTMNRRNVIYTAISRAENSVILIGTKKYYKESVLNNDIDKRNTLLGSFTRILMERSINAKSS